MKLRKKLRNGRRGEERRGEERREDKDGSPGQARG
jgi:hypothetical protein